MEKQAIKLEISNSRNDNKSVEWFFCETKEEKNKWIDEKKKEEYNWNYNTYGAVSIRYYIFSEYLICDLMEKDISDLEGIKLKEFIELIKNHL